MLNSGLREQEVIFVDDGSTDATPQIIQNLLGANPNITFLANDRNMGGGVTRNKGVECAKYPLVFILDSDDVLSPGSLVDAVGELKSSNVDGVATAQSVFFSSDIKAPLKIIKYKTGLAHFNDLTSHTPSSVTGNLLFTKQAFLDVGGYPTHHSFDTQGFGFRLLQNNKKIMVGNSFMYYQRLPLQPSYYVRESRAGNVNRNWFYIFFECLYKFSPEIRQFILNFPYSDPILLAKGQHLFNMLADQAVGRELYSDEATSLGDRSAYHLYAKSADYSLNAWCLGYELRHQHYDLAFKRFRDSDFPMNSFRIFYPLIAELFGSKLPAHKVEEFRYFFTQSKSLRWNFFTYCQKLLNRLGLSRWLG